MLQHIVLFRFQSPLTNDDASQMRAMIRSWAKEIGLARVCRFGEDITGARTQGYQYLLSMEFDDEDALARYRAHPTHQRFLGWIQAKDCEVLAFDYQINAQTDFLLGQ